MNSLIESKIGKLRIFPLFELAKQTSTPELNQIETETRPETIISINDTKPKKAKATKITKANKVTKTKVAKPKKEKKTKAVSEKEDKNQTISRNTKIHTKILDLDITNNIQSNNHFNSVFDGKKLRNYLIF